MKKSRSLLALLLTLAMFAALLGIGAAAILIFMGWYTTRIRTIEIKPIPDGYTGAELIEISGLEYGRSILFQSLADAKANIEQDAYLRAVVQYDFPNTIRITIEQRTAARKAKDFKTADEIRDKLKEMGIILEDTPQGVKWTKA